MFWPRRRHWYVLEDWRLLSYKTREDADPASQPLALIDLRDVAISVVPHETNQFKLVYVASLTLYARIRIPTHTHARTDTCNIIIRPYTRNNSHSLHFHRYLYHSDNVIHCRRLVFHRRRRRRRRRRNCRRHSFLPFRYSTSLLCEPGSPSIVVMCGCAFVLDHE